MNDGPLSYETSCSSPGGDTPLRSRETPGDEVSDDGGARKGAKRRRGKAKISRDRDEKVSGYVLLIRRQTQSILLDPSLQDVAFSRSHYFKLPRVRRREHKVLKYSGGMKRR